MSKKKFTDGLEGLFGFSEGGDLQESSPLLVDTRDEEKEAPVKKRKKKSNPNKKKSGKSFTMDLDALFSAAASKAIEEREEKRKKNKGEQPAPQENDVPPKPASLRHRRRKPVTGIDALIRQTIVGSRIDYNAKDAQKRVTFIYDKDKLARLKAIAKLEKSYLKDIIGKVVSEFIDKYEKKHGIIGPK